MAPPLGMVYPETKKLSASEGEPPDPPTRPLPLDPAGGSAPRSPSVPPAPLHHSTQQSEALIASIFLALIKQYP